MEEQYEQESINDMMGIRYTRLEKIEIAAPRVRDTQQLAKDIFFGSGLGRKQERQIEG